MVGAKHRIFLSPSTFLALRVQLVVFGERFRDGQYSLVSFLIAVHLLVVPLCTAICKSGGHVPPCHMQLSQLDVTTVSNVWTLLFVCICILNLFLDFRVFQIGDNMVVALSWFSIFVDCCNDASLNHCVNLKNCIIWCVTRWKRENEMLSTIMPNVSDSSFHFCFFQTHFKTSL